MKAEGRDASRPWVGSQGFGVGPDGLPDLVTENQLACIQGDDG